ncbi:MFS transporter [Actinomadura parmotrematis]|uniref:MFS transporter n=1 Tax=Actinomadura parmotrematis TaxID=2864039 RepID=A0ABS7FU39_9ACTN|nr:MFS transporter [Actinomadura parmotrematis]MBW8483249.1 MFS transporter [Actinomadura parmotrematis]
MATSAWEKRRAGLPARARGAVVALCLVQFIDVMGVTVVLTVLPRMLDDVGAGASAGTPVATGYAMFFGGLLMLGARLGDRIGYRRCILLSLAVFAAESALAALAGSALVLAAARCAQGAAAALAVPSALRLLTSVTGGDERARARALAGWSAAGAAASASGFVVGGTLGELAGWRPVFWGLAAVAGVLAALVAALAPPVRAEGGAPLNLAGTALLTAGVMLLVVGATLLGEPPHRVLGAGLLAGAAAALALFVPVDRRSDAPLLPGPLLALPQVRNGTVAAFANTATTTGAATLITLYLQGALGWSQLRTAAAFLPLSVLVIAGSASAARLLARWPGERVCALGLALIGAGLALPLLRIGSLPLLGTGMGLAGLGLGLSSVASTSLATDVPEGPRAAASGLVNTSAQLGSAIGTAVLLLAATAAGRPPGTGAPTFAWASAAVAALLVAAAATRRSPARSSRRAGR